MTNAVQVFNFENSEIRTTVIEGTPYFVGKDVAEILGYTNPTKSIRMHVDKEDKKMGVQNGAPSIVDNLGREQYPMFITESGVYALIFGSKLPSAKKFKRWVTNDVLPDIRKTGSYQAQPALRLPENNAEMLQVIQSANEEQNKRIDQVEDTVDDLKDRFGLPAAQAKSLEQARRRHVVTLLGGFDSNAYQHISGKTFRQIGRDFKERFNVPRYDSLPLSKFDEGMDYIKTWLLPTNLALEVRELNSQTELDV